MADLAFLLRHIKHTTHAVQLLDVMTLDYSLNLATETLRVKSRAASRALAESRAIESCAIQSQLSKLLLAKCWRVHAFLAELRVLVH